MTSKIAEMRMKAMNSELEEDYTLEEALEKVAQERAVQELEPRRDK